MPAIRRIRRPLRALSCIIAVAVLSACASTPPPAQEFIPPLYPPAPAEPRFVYERTLLYNEDVEGVSRKQRFVEFATGASRKLKGMVKPFDVAVHKGRVYVSDSVQRLVLVFDIPGERFFEIGGKQAGQLLKPLGITVAADGTLYVADVTAQRIQAYDTDGKFLRSIGEHGVLSRPADVDVSPDGRLLYVVDTGGVDSDVHAVFVFDAHSGELVRTIGKRGTEPGEFNLPLQAAVDAAGILHVVDSGNFRVQSFDSDGNFRSAFGSVGRFPGQFARPKGIATDPQGNIYVIDTAFGNFQIFTPGGELLMFIGERGHAGLPGNYMLPAGITVDEDGRIYVVDQFFRKVDIYRPVGLRPEQGYAGTAGAGPS